MENAIHTPEGYTDRIRQELSRRYIYLYEKITGRSFEFPEVDQPIEARLESNLEGIA